MLKSCVGHLYLDVHTLSALLKNKLVRRFSLMEETSLL
jgi:hypothetical protein